MVEAFLVAADNLIVLTPRTARPEALQDILCHIMDCLQRSVLYGHSLSRRHRRPC